jgi:hypothetical protein
MKCVTGERRSSENFTDASRRKRRREQYIENYGIFKIFADNIGSH